MTSDLSWVHVEASLTPGNLDSRKAAQILGVTGVDERLFYLVDQLGQGDVSWVVQSVGAIRDDAPLSALVVDRFLLWLLEVELKDYPTSEPVAALYRRRIAGDEPTPEEWNAAARAVAEAAARAVAEAAAWAAEAAARAAWVRAEAAARAAARAVAEAAARAAEAYGRMRNKLTEILEAR